MPRYKEYNEVRVVEKAMYQFWLHGYGASSIALLTDAMRINKFTFYEAFESKEALLLKTMTYYYDTFFKEALENLHHEKNVMGFISTILQPRKDNLRGCFILTITAETGNSIPGAITILREYISQLEQTLQEVVLYLHPESVEKERKIMTQQLLALLTSVPLMHSLKSEQFCTAYAQKIISRLH